MKIVVLTNEKNSVLEHIEKQFLHNLIGHYTFDQYSLPKNHIHTCRSCRRCFNIDEQACPHYDIFSPIWWSMLSSDLIVFNCRALEEDPTENIKNLFDHFACHQLQHRPEADMFSKRAVIISYGENGKGRATNDYIKSNLRGLGIGRIKSLALNLGQASSWHEIPVKMQARLDKKIVKLAESMPVTDAGGITLQIFIPFSLSRIAKKHCLQKGIRNKDIKHWINEGWLKYRSCDG